MKKLLIKSGVFLITFILTVVIAGRFMNRGNHDMTMKMGAATLPVVTFLQEEIQVNELHGHTTKMDVASMALNIIQLDENRRVAFQVQTFGEAVKEIVLEVRSCDGSRLIEKIQMEAFEEEDGLIRIETGLKDLLEKNTDYALVVVLGDEADREIRYYTRCVWNDALNAAEKLAFVKDFHETTFDKEAAVELKKYLESNSSGDNTTLHKVNIHSSFQQVTWGELEAEPVTDPVIDILELGRDTGSFLLRRIVASGTEKDRDYYTVEEYYRIRYTTSRVYLLDFERIMTQIPDLEGKIYTHDKIYLGIAGKDLQMKESEDGNYLAFVASDRLTTYNMNTNKIALLYSFYDQENQDARTLYDGHEIKILNIDDQGNVQFAVCGYFNRGKHEGETGISVYDYDSTMNTIEEKLYIPYGKSWQALLCDAENLCFMNQNRKFYVYLNGCVYETDVESLKTREMIRLAEGDTLHLSQDHRILLWNQKDQLQILDLESEQSHKIAVREEERILSMGFMGSDVIYGMVRESDIIEDASGRDILPMYKLVICDASGQVLKEYEEENLYTLSIDVMDNQITLNRVRKSDDRSYVTTVPEHILNNATQVSGKNKIVTTAIDVYQTITQIQVRKNIDGKTLQILTPKEIVFEGQREILVEESKESSKQYYVYNQNGIDGIFSDPAEAVLLAYNTSGRVVDERGYTVWFKGNRVARNQIMAITEPQKVDSRESLAVCLNTILKFEGITADAGSLLNEGKDALEILQEQMVNADVADMTGCPMDAMLYFTNKDIPVLAVLSNGEAVLITGFNEFNIVVFEPSTGKLYKKGLNDSAKWFAENGNRFIAYFEEEE